MDQCDACECEFNPEDLRMCACGAKVCINCYYEDGHDSHDDNE